MTLSEFFVNRKITVLMQIVIITIFDLLSATFLTLLVIPAACSMFNCIMKEE